MSAIDAAAVARFRGDLAATLPRDPAGPIALAVSGGPDSMAMLALAAAAFPGRVIAATVDHQLRAASAEEARMVAEWCVHAEIPHETLAPTEPIGPSDLQAQARQVRYALLSAWAIARGAACVATAHHADDQAETFLMRAVRGAGPAGLAGIRASRRIAPSDARLASDDVAGDADDGLRLVRPMLGWRRAELRAIAVAGGVPFVDDPSNRDDTFERVRVRALLGENPWLDPVQLARAAAHAAETDHALKDAAALFWRTRRVAPVGIEAPGAEIWLRLADLPRELKRRLAREAIAAVRLRSGISRPAFDQASNVEALLDALESGAGATQGGIMASARGSVWRFRAAPPRRMP